jgi:hypothetical protein
MASLLYGLADLRGSPPVPGTTVLGVDRADKLIETARALAGEHSVDSCGSISASSDITSNQVLPS